MLQVRNLKWLGFRVPLAVVNKAHTANQIYPFAVSLIESVRMYERTCDKVTCALLFGFTCVECDVTFEHAFIAWATYCFPKIFLYSTMLMDWLPGEICLS